jgi:hypothetical protein
VNAVELKAAELVATAAKYGFDADVTRFGDSYILISYVSGNLSTRIQMTVAGNASVKTYERKNKITNYEFEYKLAEYKKIADRKAGVAA